MELISIIVMFIFIYYMIIRQNTYLTFSIRTFNYNSTILYKILQLGIPASLSMIIMSMGVMLFNKILGSSEKTCAHLITSSTDLSSLRIGITSYLFFKLFVSSPIRLGSKTPRDVRGSRPLGRK